MFKIILTITMSAKLIQNERGSALQQNIVSQAIVGPATKTPAPACYHCGLPCPAHPVQHAQHPFCCNGCVAVFQILHESGMGNYYSLAQHPGTPGLVESSPQERFHYLDDPQIKKKLGEFSDGRIAQITLAIPHIHCISCIWLLENLYRIEQGILHSKVDLLHRKVRLSYDEHKISLSRVVTLLSSLGYTPKLNLDALDTAQNLPDNRSDIIKIGIAGFCFGNVMLLCLPEYLASGDLPPQFARFFQYLSLLLTLPALFYCGSDWLRSSLVALRRRTLAMDVPVALGLVVLFIRSAWEIVTGAGPGYLDSLCGFIFFLLAGKFFQKKSFATLSFDRDYKAYFPLSITREHAGQDTVVPIGQLAIGDTIRVRNQEIIPADGELMSNRATVDYSFVTGEADPIVKRQGAALLAGGRILGNAANIKVLRPVSQSFLAGVWNSYQAVKHQDFQPLSERISPYFTKAILLVALGSGLWFWLHGQMAQALYAFSSVLVVACPCALAISSPFTYGAMIRLLERRGIFVKNGAVLEKLAKINTVVFDKTGTLTQSRLQLDSIEGELTTDERHGAAALAQQSVHPVSRALVEFLGPTPALLPDEFQEFPGKGITGMVAGQTICIGRLDWVAEQHGWPEPQVLPGSAGNNCLAIAVAGQRKATLAIRNLLRDGLCDTLRKLARHYELHLVSGDSDRDRALLGPLFPDATKLTFACDPFRKLDYVKQLQQAGRHVAMVGDGLNDAGALLQSNVALAVIEENSYFSPASDVILQGSQFRLLPKLFDLAAATTWVIRGNFALSLAYNIFGIALAGMGQLSPLAVAILMPLSSVSVIAVAMLGSLVLVKIYRVI